MQVKHQQDSNDTITEDASTLQKCCWVREQQNLKLQCLISDIQTALICRSTLINKVEQFKKLINEIKISDKSLKEKESFIINKYFLIKTDTQLQKQLLFKALEGVLNSYKRNQQLIDRLGTIYENKQMFVEQMQIKAEVEGFKKELRESCQQAQLSIPEVLQQTAQFSRSRLDNTLEIAQKSSLKWKTTFFSEDKIQKEKLRSSKRSVDNERSTLNISPIRHRGLQPLYLQPHYAHNLQYKKKTTQLLQNSQVSEVDQLTQSEKPIKIFGKNDFISKRVNLSKYEDSEYNLVINNNKTQYNTRIIQEDKSPFQGYSEVNDNHMYISVSPIDPTACFLPSTTLKLKSPNIFSYKLKKTVLKSTTIQSVMPSFLKYQNPFNKLEGIENFRSIKDTYVNDNYYKEYQNEFVSLNENEQKTTLFKMYKDLLRVNQGILYGIDSFRRSYTNFLQKTMDLPKLKNYRYTGYPLSQSVKVKSSDWSCMYHQIKQNYRKIPFNFDLKEIGNMIQAQRQFLSPLKIIRNQTEYTEEKQGKSIRQNEK